MPPHADSSWDLIAATIIAIPSLAAAIAAWHNRRDIKTVKYQVQNNHKQNFRDEVTDIGVVVDRLGENIDSLRYDIATERSERRESIRELREDLHDRLENHRKLL